MITIFLGKTKKNKFKTFFFVLVKKNLAQKMVLQNHVQKNLKIKKYMIGKKRQNSVLVSVAFMPRYIISIWMLSSNLSKQQCGRPSGDPDKSQFYIWPPDGSLTKIMLFFQASPTILISMFCSPILNTYRYTINWYILG